MNVESISLHRVGFVVLKNGAPVRTGHRSVPYDTKDGRKRHVGRKGSKLYQHAGVARRIARELATEPVDRRHAGRGKTAVFAASIVPSLAGDLSDEIEIAGYFPIGFAVVSSDGRPIKTTTSETSAKLYSKAGTALRIAARFNRASGTDGAKVHRVFI